MPFAAAMRLPEDSEITRSGVNILPMIDVIFAILAFFILSTLYLTRAEGLPIERPILVTIRADELSSHGDVVAARDQLRSVNNVRLGIATIQP